MMSKPTLVDVGRAAGVSAITVSRTLRSPDKVSDSMRKRVARAVAELGYVPNKAAATLASNTTDAVVVMIPSFSNNVFTDVLLGIEDVLHNTRFTIQIGYTRYDPLEEERLLRSFLNPKPAGVILAGVDQNDETKRMLRDLGIPVIQFMDFDPDPIDHIVGFSHVAAARAGVEHMLAQGFQNIGYLSAQMDPRAQKRLAGYREALDHAGLKYDNSVVQSNKPTNARLGGLLLNKLLMAFPECDAVFCNNDDLALGVLFECQRRGLRVPQDIGICGYNDLGVASEAFPSISSVATQLRTIGETAGEVFMSVVKGDCNDRQVIDLGFELKVRNSTGLQHLADAADSGSQD